MLAAGALGIAAFLWMKAPPTLDQATLCPLDPDTALPITVLLIDPSTPLDAKHRVELRRVMREMGIEGTPLHIPVGGRIVGYHLPPVTLELDEALAPADEFCNPGGRPGDRGTMDALTEGRLHAEERWRRFTRRLEGLFPTEAAPKQGGTPLLESLAILAARYAHSAREEDGRRMHLVVWSDLLQNSPFMTQYEAGWDARSAEEWLADGANAHLRTDMRGIDVSAFRLSRPEHEELHTDAHFKWWAEYFTGLGATLHWQESI